MTALATRYLASSDENVSSSVVAAHPPTRLVAMQRLATTMPAPSPSIRILVIEDEQKLREALAEGLRLENWSVVTAGSGTEALQHLAGDRFDLLILDWMLPDHDGVELLRRLRAAGSRTPALIVSARFSHVDQGTAIQSGATDYLVKPFGFTDLLARCRALLAQT